MHSVLFAPAAEEVELLIADLYERGTAGIIEEGPQIRAFFQDETDYGDLLEAYRVLEMRTENAVPSAPLEENCDPIAVGEKFFIVPGVSGEPTPPGRYRLTINETTAFGTGRHETTQLMLTALERILLPGDSVLDIGTGSGILSRAAELLGAKRVWSGDIYETGLRSGSNEYHMVFVGSADAVLDGVADLTLANITPGILDAIAHELKRVSKPGARILISGFLRGSEPQRFRAEAVWEQDDWLCWLCRKEGIDDSGPHILPAIHDQDWW